MLAATITAAMCIRNILAGLQAGQQFRSWDPT